MTRYGVLQYPDKVMRTAWRRGGYEAAYGRFRGFHRAIKKILHEWVYDWVTQTAHTVIRLIFGDLPFHRSLPILRLALPITWPALCLPRSSLPRRALKSGVGSVLAPPNSQRLDKAGTIQALT